MYLVTVTIAFYVYIALDVGNRSEIVARLSRNEDDSCIMGMPHAGMQIQRHPFVETASSPSRRKTIRWRVKNIYSRYNDPAVLSWQQDRSAPP